MATPFPGFGPNCTPPTRAILQNLKTLGALATGCVAAASAADFGTGADGVTPTGNPEPMDGNPKYFSFPYTNIPPYLVVLDTDADGNFIPIHPSRTDGSVWPNLLNESTWTFYQIRPNIMIPKASLVSMTPAEAVRESFADSVYLPATYPLCSIYAAVYGDSTHTWFDRFWFLPGAQASSPLYPVVPIMENGTPMMYQMMEAEAKYPVQSGGGGGGTPAADDAADIIAMAHKLDISMAGRLAAEAIINDKTLSASVKRTKLLAIK